MAPRDKSIPQFPRVSLVQKIAAGYAAMALFTMAALFFSSSNLYSVHRTTREVAEKDLPIITALIRLRTSLLAQESFAGKYAILRDPAFVDLYGQREKESETSLAVLEEKGASEELKKLKPLYLSYQKASQQLFSGGAADTQSARATAVKLINAVDACYLNRQDLLQGVLKRAGEQQKATLRSTVVISCAGFLLALAVAPWGIYHAFSAIKKLQNATHRIAEGDFDYDPQVPHSDEFGELAKDFSRMAARLKVLEQYNLDASPLTRLPGNQAIERVLEERLATGETFAFCYADLDNFKPFSDHYGYAKGSELLRVTGDLIYETVMKECGEAGFVGHIGGDDFVMVVPADQAAAVCEAVIGNFDAEAARHYQPEHVKAGGIEGLDRYGVHRFFPITTISIAIIICGRGEYSSAVEIARAASVVKDSAKETAGSSYLISQKKQET
jgi:diguanylate cyclase (GGDEF)-like protein